jgi:hypothetical protein
METWTVSGLNGSGSTSFTKSRIPLCFIRVPRALLVITSLIRCGRGTG